MQQNMNIHDIATALFNRDVGRSLPLGMGICDEYGLKGLCGPDCPGYGKNDYCVDEASVFDADDYLQGDRIIDPDMGSH